MDLEVKSISARLAIYLFAALLWASASAAHAEQATKIPRIGFLGNSNETLESAQARVYWSSGGADLIAWTIEPGACGAIANQIVTSALEITDRIWPCISCSYAVVDDDCGGGGGVLIEDTVPAVGSNRAVIYGHTIIGPFDVKTIFTIATESNLFNLQNVPGSIDIEPVIRRA